MAARTSGAFKPVAVAIAAALSGSSRKNSCISFWGSPLVSQATPVIDFRLGIGIVRFGVAAVTVVVPQWKPVTSWDAKRQGSVGCLASIPEAPAPAMSTTGLWGS